jgi:hypothetical protein
MRKFIFVIAGCTVVLVGILGFVCVGNKDVQEMISAAIGKEAPRDPEDKDVEIRELQLELEKTKSERNEAQQKLARLESILGRRSLSPGRGETAASSTNDTTDLGSREKATRALAKKAEVWKNLAGQIISIMAQVDETGGKPTPELMKAVSGMMGMIADLQKEMGYEDPGYVTSAPSFQFEVAAALLEKAGKPLTDEEKARLGEMTTIAQGRYHEAAKSGGDRFALERIRDVVRETNAYRQEMGGVIGQDRLAGTPLEGSLAKSSGSARETEWPSQSSVGVKTLEDAGLAIARRWMNELGMPKGEQEAVNHIARDYVMRSHSAKIRYGADGSKMPTAQDRKALDMELVSLQTEALRRIHDNLSLSEEVRKKVVDYGSLDRFHIGETGSWSQSGNFGNFKFSSSKDEEHENSRPAGG